MKKISILLLCLILFAINSLAAVENLDEMINRKARQRSNTFYSGETASPYIWQPQTLQYNDTTTGHEVWRMSNTPATGNIYHDDLRWSSWSADGKYLAYATDMFDSLNYKTNAFDGDGFGVWLTPRTDGTVLKPIVDGPTRVDEHQPFFTWSPNVKDTYYSFGRTRAGNTTVSSNYLYKGTITDSTTTNTFMLDFPGTLELKIPRTISGDGLKILATEWAEDNLYPATVYPTPALDDADGYSIALDIDTYWGDATEPITAWHGETMGGAAGNYWVYFNTVHTWWRMRLTGSGADGEPIHTIDHTIPYDWGDELEPANAAFTGNNPFSGSQYWSHGATDKWGRFIIFSQTNASPISPGVEDTVDHVIDQEAYGLGGAEHHDYSAWSDYFVSTRGPAGYPYNFTLDFLATMKYNAGSTSRIDICDPHTLFNNSGAYNGSTYEYNTLPRPFQSPDGTKIGFHSTFLNSKVGIYDNKPDVFWSVAYYPYPPDVKAVTATGNVVTVEAHWNLAGTTRGYTTRGWPVEGVNDPPPPREVKEFRLWRSTNKIIWTPIKTFTYDIFDKYDFSDGTWETGTEATNTWSTTDAVSNGTYYYAVTSIENSKLESHTLSNIFSITVAAGSGTGSEDTVYPTSPGGDTDITLSYNSNLHLGYNLYAKEGSAPPINQTNKIFSLVGTLNSYVDWLGTTTGNYRYIVTAFDTQGNESSALETVVAYQQSPATAPGQYTITWTDDLQVQPVVTLQANFSTSISPTSYTGEIEVVPGTTLTDAVSFNNYSVSIGAPTGLIYPITVTGVIPTITDTITAIDSNANTGQNSITITLTEQLSGVTIYPTATPLTISPTGTPVTITP